MSLAVMELWGPNKRRWLFAGALLISWFIFFLFCSATKALAAGDHTLIKIQDVKLMADFTQPVFTGGGRPLAPQVLRLSGGAQLVPGKGLVLQKGGVNEIPDPSFEGDGWELFPGAAISSSAEYSGKKALDDNGKKALMVKGGGPAQVSARLKEPIPFVDEDRPASTRLVGRTRALSFSYYFSEYHNGSLKIALIALDENRTVMGSKETELTKQGEGWQDGGFIYEFPDDTAYYQVEISGAGLAGTAFLDAVKAEHKDYFTPYFDGDSNNGMWVNAAAPDNLSAQPASARTLPRAPLIITILLGTVFLVAPRYLPGKKRYRWLFFFLGIVIAVFAATALAVPRFSTVLADTLSGNRAILAPEKTYFYRISSVDSNGWESPASSELRAFTGSAGAFVLSWMPDPGAAKYRLYRGTESYQQNEFTEIDGSQSQLIDNGNGFQPGEVAAITPSGSRPHASRSLRPAPDARIDTDAIGFTPNQDFWLSGELTFGFDSSRPFRPASLFEAGNAANGATLAVSFRYVPGWDDKAAKILLIKTGPGQMETADTDFTQVAEFRPGSRLKYLVAQLYESYADMPAGAHLWYSIDGGETKHLFIRNFQPFGEGSYFVVSKRNYYDYFANNSAARSFTLVQSAIDNRIVDYLMPRSEPVPKLITAISGRTE